MSDQGRPLVVGIDIGGTKTAILVTAARNEPGGTVRARTIAPTAVGAPERAADAIAALVSAALAEAGARPRRTSRRWASACPGASTASSAT